MGKEQQSKKETKKQPLLSPKEKRLQKMRRRLPKRLHRWALAKQQGVSARSMA
ncbi:MAG: hypothetical protein IPJ38_17035 [Dechloromonas sp.]|uniref:Uncharacterized protein n=1 Tax=Candidatus Dechloromonas phosphorivorans TaxID=2899244 RepID=A0A935KBT9_9RHOO|nr:hypothetical protein [Candidatus Dechloromonas phosphorivorans]